MSAHAPRRPPEHLPAAADSLDALAATIAGRLRRRGVYVTTYTTAGERRALQRAAGFVRRDIATPMHVRSGGGVLAVWLDDNGTSGRQAAHRANITFAELSARARSQRRRGGASRTIHLATHDPCGARP
ncbi:hypothetical protein [Planomonospora sp. ID82291]|uniref:hypothetical protein n=1 Tax=Planomonospora sp. ID82291 TaxID=2738136 RepID=UPI0018C352C9|nr:hypothetical protein [Planomonospora sp. ID82291]MBG0818716.1 hypothetical protein [Planomonospora sp. ID82291]